MEIRNATLQDLDRIMEIYDIARNFMRANGNFAQWGNGYPARNLIREDIARGESYVIADDTGIHGVFLFMHREEPTYAVIEDGAWPNDLPYGTIHRVATDGKCRGLFDLCVAFCAERANILRIDTHKDNLPMQKAIARNGFARCGIVYMADGSPRIAYQKTV